MLRVCMHVRVCVRDESKVGEMLQVCTDVYVCGIKIGMVRCSGVYPCMCDEVGSIAEILQGVYITDRAYVWDKNGGALERC